MALYQSYCASCTNHLPTTSEQEGAPDYAELQLLGYCASGPTEAAPRELKRVYSAAASDHFATADPAEPESVQSLGYALEPTLCWVP